VDGNPTGEVRNLCDQREGGRIIKTPVQRRKTAWTDCFGKTAAKLEKEKKKFSIVGKEENVFNEGVLQN